MAGFEKIGLIDDAVDTLVSNEEYKKRFTQLAGLAWRLFKSILPDTNAYQFEEQSQLLHSLQKKIQALSPPVSIDRVMGDIEQVLDLSIDAEGYIISDNQGVAN